MEMLAARTAAQHTRIRLATHRDTEFVDLTDRLHAFTARAQLSLGILTVQTLHTTTAIVVNEHEPLLLQDFERVLAALAPPGRYLHDDSLRRTVNRGHNERVNGHAHCRALFLPSSVSLNVADGALQLGRWQRVFLVELDGPQERFVSVSLFGEPAR